MRRLTDEDADPSLEMASRSVNPSIVTGETCPIWAACLRIGMAKKKDSDFGSGSPQEASSSTCKL